MCEGFAKDPLLVKSERAVNLSMADSQLMYACQDIPLCYVNFFCCIFIQALKFFDVVWKHKSPY